MRVDLAVARRRLGALADTGFVPLLLAIAAVGFYLLMPTKDDVSWLITNAEALFDGKTLYVDLVETNPPLSILLYTPAVLFERLTGLRAEIWSILFTALLALWCARYSVRGLGLARRDGAVVEIIIAVVFLWLPLGAFEQKDHVAAMIALPLVVDLAGFSAGLAGGGKPGRIRWPSSVLAGLAVAIKPQFVLAVVFPALALAVFARSWRPIINAGTMVSAGVFLAFQGVVYLCFPAFFTNVLPLVLELYAPARQSLYVLIGTDMGAMALLILMIGGLGYIHRRPGAVDIALVAASLGFFVAFVLQGKGWPYHLYPALSYAFILTAGFATPLFPGASGVRSPATVPFMLAFAFLVSCHWMMLTWIDYRQLTEAIKAEGIQSPRILSISAAHAAGHPSTRDAGGIWVGTYFSRWISVRAMNELVNGAPDESHASALKAWIAHDRSVLRSDIADRHPDLILLEQGPHFDWLAWARQDAETARLLDGYAESSRVPDLDDDGDVVILRRR